MKIALASDHGGYQMKEAIRARFGEGSHTLIDLGTHGENSVDYPPLALQAAEGVARGEYDRAILVCGTGIGMCMVANKVPGVRAALCNEGFSARASREHNDANILTLGARVLGLGLAMDIVAIWLSTDFAGERHARRLQQMADVEKRYSKE